MLTTEWNLEKVYLMLGNACNFSCRHCIQDGHDKSELQSPLVTDTVFSYLEHLVAIRPSNMGKLQIMFWGGEPLLYMDCIKTVIDRLSDKVSYTIVSNGLLLTPELVEYFNTHSVCYVLSNDGRNTDKVRGVNLLECKDFQLVFNSLNTKAIDAVISAHNQDYYVLWEYLDEKCPNTTIFTEFLQVAWDMPSDLYEFNADAFKKHLQSIAQKAHDDIANGVVSREVLLMNSHTNKIANIVGQSVKEESTFLKHPKCLQIRKAMNIDVLGNVYACHNFNEKLGTVADDYDVLLEQYDRLMDKLTTNSTCSNCEYLSICRYGCPFVQDSIGKKATCDITKIFIKSCIEYVASFDNILLPVDLEID